MRSKTRRTLRRAAADYDAFLEREARSSKRRNPAPTLGTSVCYDAASGALVGAAPYGGLVPQLVEVFEETATVRVRHQMLPGGEAIAVLCVDSLATAPAVPTSDDCCVDLTAMSIVCQDTSSPLHGAAVVSIAQTHEDGLVTLTFVDPSDGVAKNARFYPCTTVPRTCCYDVASGQVICSGGGSAVKTPVSLVAMAPQADGSIMAMVDAPDLPDDLKHLPICADAIPAGCCYDAAAEAINCPDSELHGRAAGIVAAWESDGQIYVWAVWEGGGARMPLCPGQTECPPVFCCVNLQTSLFVCPGQPALNGTPAPVSEVISDDGYTWALLEDGTRMPVCGTECAPPRTCPECPSCPRGLWMSPDGTCVEEPECEACETPQQECPPCDKCPTCPPGMLLDTQTGRCVPVEKRPPEEYCPPWWKLAGHCCENCALGRECSDCDDDCDCKKTASPLRPMDRLANPSLSSGHHRSAVTLGPPGTSYATDPGCPSGQVYCGSPQNENDPPICCSPTAVPAGYRMLTRREVRRLRRKGILPPEPKRKFRLFGGNG